MCNLRYLQQLHKILNAKALVDERKSFCHLYPKELYTPTAPVIPVRTHKYQYLTLCVSADFNWTWGDAGLGTYLYTCASN